MELITLEGINNTDKKFKMPEFLNRKTENVLSVAKTEISKAVKELDFGDYLTIAGEAMQQKYDKAKSVFSPAIQAATTEAKKQYAPVAYATIAGIFAGGLIVGILVGKYVL